MFKFSKIFLNQNSHTLFRDSFLCHGVFTPAPPLPSRSVNARLTAPFQNLPRCVQLHVLWPRHNWITVCHDRHWIGSHLAAIMPAMRLLISNDLAGMKKCSSPPFTTRHCILLDFVASKHRQPPVPPGRIDFPKRCERFVLALENSPAIYGWVAMQKRKKSRQGRKNSAKP
jgi:hypothetical protein